MKHIFRLAFCATVLSCFPSPAEVRDCRRAVVFNGPPGFDYAVSALDGPPVHLKYHADFWRGPIHKDGTWFQLSKFPIRAIHSLDGVFYILDGRPILLSSRNSATKIIVYGANDFDLVGHSYKFVFSTDVGTLHRLNYSEPMVNYGAPVERKLESWSTDSFPEPITRLATFGNQGAARVLTADGRYHWGEFGKSALMDLRLAYSGRPTLQDMASETIIQASQDGPVEVGFEQGGNLLGGKLKSEAEGRRLAVRAPRDAAPFFSLLTAPNVLEIWMPGEKGYRRIPLACDLKTVEQWDIVDDRVVIVGKVGGQSRKKLLAFNLKDAGTRAPSPSYHPIRPDGAVTALHVLKASDDGLEVYLGTDTGAVQSIKIEP